MSKSDEWLDNILKKTNKLQRFALKKCFATYKQLVAKDIFDDFIKEVSLMYNKEEFHKLKKKWCE